MATALPDGLVLPILIMAVIILALLWNDRISKSSGSKSRSGGSNGGGSGTKEKEPDGPKITKLELYPHSVNPGDEMVIRGEYETNAGVSEFNLTYDDEEVSVGNIGGGNFSSEKIEAKQGEHNGSAYIKDENGRSHSLSTSFYINNQGKTLEPPTIEVHPKIQDDKIIVTVEGIPTTADSISETTIKVDGVGKQEEQSNKAELIFDRKPGNYSYTATTTDSNNQEAEQKGSFPVTEKVGETEEGTESQRIHNFIEQNIKPVITELKGKSPELARSFQEVVEQIENILGSLQGIEIDSQDKKQEVRDIEKKLEEINRVLLAKLNEATYRTVLNIGEVQGGLEEISNKLNDIHSEVSVDPNVEDLVEISNQLGKTLEELQDVNIETEGDAINELNIGDLPDEVQEAIDNLNQIAEFLENVTGESIFSDELIEGMVEIAEMFKESDEPVRGERRVAALAETTQLEYLIFYAMWKSQDRGSNASQYFGQLVQQNQEDIQKLYEMLDSDSNLEEILIEVGKLLEERNKLLQQMDRGGVSQAEIQAALEAALSNEDVTLDVPDDLISQLEQLNQDSADISVDISTIKSYEHLLIDVEGSESPGSGSNINEGSKNSSMAKRGLLLGEDIKHLKQAESAVMELEHIDEKEIEELERLKKLLLTADKLVQKLKAEVANHTEAEGYDHILEYVADTEIVLKEFKKELKDLQSYEEKFKQVDEQVQNALSETSDHLDDQLHKEVEEVDEKYPEKNVSQEIRSGSHGARNVSAVVANIIGEDYP